MGSVCWHGVVFSLAGPIFHDPLCLDGEVDDEFAVHDHGFKLGPGSSLMNLQLITVVAGDVRCGYDYIVIFRWLVRNINGILMWYYYSERLGIK